MQKIVFVKRLRNTIIFRTIKGNKSRTIEPIDFRDDFPTIAIVNIKKQIIL